MTTAHEMRNLIEQTTTGTRRRRVPEEVKEQVRCNALASSRGRPPRAASQLAFDVAYGAQQLRPGGVRRNGQ